MASAGCLSQETLIPGNMIRSKPARRPLCFNYSASNGNLWSLPNATGTGSLGLANNENVNGKTYLERNQTDFKTNWNPTSKLSTFIRFGWGNNYWTTPTMFGVLGGPGLSQTNTAQGYGGTSVYSGTVSGTYIISPSLIFDAHYGYDMNSAFSVQPGADQNLGWTVMQIPEAWTRRGSPAKYKASHSRAGYRASRSTRASPRRYCSVRRANSNPKTTGIQRKTSTPISHGSRELITCDSVSTPIL